MKILFPNKNKKIKFFIADDTIISTFRDEVISMEHPFFALRAGDTKTRKYKNGRVTVIIRSLADLGLATIFDKDIWIYSISKLQEAINNDEKINRTIVFTPYDFFVNTNRAKCSRAYEDLKKALSRLNGTVIQTNIVFSEEKKEIKEFGLIDHWRILEEKKGKIDIGMVEITLPNWLYQAIKKTKVLQINQDYFRIRKAIDRRLYQIARKHCGNQDKFIISLNKLYLKSGSNSILTKFKFNVKQLVRLNDLPGYEVNYDPKNNNVFFVNRNKNLKKNQLSNKKN